jgi:hypothetical protein
MYLICKALGYNLYSNYFNIKYMLKIFELYEYNRRCLNFAVVSWYYNGVPSSMD